MQGYLCLILHAHLPFVRHPEHERFLEENWLFEAITETYLPLLELARAWNRDRLSARLTLSLTPTLCSMLRDPLLRERYERHLDDLIDLAEKEIHRTLWQKQYYSLAVFYHQRLSALREVWQGSGGDLVSAFGALQDAGQIEIITSAATHGLLPLLASHPPSVRAQILVARDHYRDCFGRDPRGIWLPECAYCDGLEPVLREANLRWFVVDTHGLMHANPRPRYAVFAPIFTRSGVAVFGRDHDSARQVWSRHEGYPGDHHYRDFYRDIGFDLDLDYVRPHLSGSEQRGFTGIKYYRITGSTETKQVYDRVAALETVRGHAAHFLSARREQVSRLAAFFDRPPALVAPYDAELFGHWWYEGPEFLDAVVRAAAAQPDQLQMITPEDYLRFHPTNQVATPAASSWGEEGYWRVWLNDKNEWIYRLLRPVQDQMTALVRSIPQPDPLQERWLRQAGRELLLAQASDWPFILRTGTSPEYARRRVNDHLQRFSILASHLRTGNMNETILTELEARDNLFPALDYRYWG